ncbi:MAG: cation-translocating P-type ATPase [Acidobacteria bacterium]|jgi:Ca2+-transporting ATPase|nr:cation-translocating P-type ATPase [Acidobacteriota bacterium]
MNKTTNLWHTLSIEDTYANLNTAENGLNNEEAARRLEEYGPNELRAMHRISPWKLLLDQFKNVLIIILVLATALSAFLGHGVEAIAITIIVLFAVLLSFAQEYRAERAIEALRQMAAPTATVIRGGKEEELPARELVPGDIIILSAGDKIPADARLIEAINLQVEESALTGESAPVDKNTAALDKKDLSPGDRKNMIFAGTAPTYGRGRGVVVTTGMDTEFGKIAGMLQTVETGRTPLQKNLDKVGRILAWAALVIVVIIVALGLFRGQPFVEMFIFGIALAVAVVPEALPAVVTISLALGVQRMAKRNALIRRLPAVETLGSTSIICSDKTGTLTKDEMTARKIFVAGKILKITGSGYEPEGEFMSDDQVVEIFDELKQFLQGATLASDTHIVQAEESGRWHVKGDPTEGALVASAAKAGLHKTDLDAEFPRIEEIPFTSETKRMTTLHNTADGVIAYSKGALEVILDSCSRYIDKDGEVPLAPETKTMILEIAHNMANEALRLLAVAAKKNAVLESAEQDMTFLGFVGMIDPPRPEVKAAIEICEKAGIKVVMITGDHPLTAQAIARELGILKNGRVVTGVELEAMSDEEFEKEVENIDVYARVSPQHKLRVVTALQKKEYIAAMTGDGVNDAPALKKADIGIAMGITGTDVTKEAAAMTLTDDNFASIVAAVEEGRGVFGNIKKYLMYLISSNIGEIGLMAITSLLGLPLPLSAVQILYVNLATDGLPALALSVDPPEADLMKRKPRDPQSGLFTRPVIYLMAMGGLWSTIVNVGIFAWELKYGGTVEHAMSMTFVSLVLIQFFKAYNFRSDHYSAFVKPFANKWLNLSIIQGIIFLVLIVYVPFLQKPFGTHNLKWIDWIAATLMAFTIFPVLELVKWYLRRRGNFSAYKNEKGNKMEIK